MFDTLITIGIVAVLCAVLTLAIWKAGPAEQLAGGMLALNWMVSLAVQEWIGEPGQLGLPLYIFIANDLVLLGALVAVCWKARREWPYIATAFQAVLIAVHLAYALNADITPRIYVSALNITSLGVLVSVAWGVWMTATAPKKVETAT